MNQLITQQTGITPIIEQIPRKENLHIAKSHWISMVKPIIYMVIGVIGILGFIILNTWFKFVIGIPSLLLLLNAISSLVYYKTFKITLKGKHLCVSSGWLTRAQLDIPIHRREGILITQSVLGRILNYGKITISTGGVMATHIIAKPNELRKQILTLE